ncbi:MAG: hypothetical protein ACFFAN_09505 [Promethearchaeota archaeon]
MGNNWFIVHDPKKWALKLENLKQKYKSLLELLLMKTLEKKIMHFD